MYCLSEIFIYPVKSLGGISLKESDITSRGFKYDRRWLLIDEAGRFITQRTYPQMALICVELREKSLEFRHKKNDASLSINIENGNNDKGDVVIWNDKVIANYTDKEMDEWFSDMLKVKCRLVYMPEESKRLVDKKYAYGNEIISFADGYPFLIIGQSSLDDLNSRLDTKLPMNRFRPNLVFTGGASFDEDRIKSFMIDKIIFYPVKPCARCVVTTVDQESGVKNEEPLKTLASYRTVGNKVMFGQNLLHKGSGTIRIGDELKILEWK
ncbi:MAG: MOSC N-terminal beta barrel domain-containing protein [Melioribacteraceae bacterium]|nr:MOSC N-terminal beta barrel domain-containing protein [Melioribacteraceae bacterium]